MDPNSTLAEMREIADRLTNGAPIERDRYTIEDFTADAERLAELVLAMDGWLRTGGFLPAAWHKAQHTPSVAAPEGWKRKPDELTTENDRLRHLLAKGGDPCIYCGLSKADMGKCASGFPGCGRADDLTLSDIQEGR